MFFFSRNDDKYVSHIFLCLLMINICPVFLCIDERYIYGFQIVVGEALMRLSSHSLGVS